MNPAVLMAKGIGIPLMTLAILTLQPALATTATSGDLYFTTFAGGQNVWKVHYNYDGAANFTLGSPSNIASTPGADGVTFAPDGDLLVGAQGDAVHKVNVTSGTFVTRNANGTSCFHIELDPSLNNAWCAGIPDGLAKIPLNPSFTNGVAQTLTGDDTQITSLAFVTTGPAAGKVFYTSSGPGGGGSFGSIDMTSFVTSQNSTSVAAAHGMVYDPFTGNLILFGSTHIAQVDPVSKNVVSDYDAGIGTLDQGTVDGKGHLFGACNCGTLVFMDYSASMKVGDPSNFVAKPFLQSNLDDAAPLVGPGAPPKVDFTFTKTASPASTNGPTLVTFTYAFSNTGQVDISTGTPSDDKCSPLTFAGGDSNGDTKVNPGETWLWTCSMVVSQTATNTATTSAEACVPGAPACIIFDFITAQATVSINKVVGGEILGIDTISLFVAGAFANATWIIPIAGATAAGIVGFALRRIKSHKG